MSNTLKDLENQVESEGFAPGSPGFKNRLLALKIERCPDIQAALGRVCCRYQDTMNWCQTALEYEKMSRNLKEEARKKTKERDELMKSKLPPVPDDAREKR